MSDHHYWYVIGRSLRLAIGIALFVSLSTVHPTSAAGVSDQAAQQATISNGSAKALGIDQTSSALAGGEPLYNAQIDGSVTPSSEYLLSSDGNLTAEELALISTAAGGAGGVYALPKTGEVFEIVLAVKRKGTTIVPGIVAYERDGEFFVPIHHLAEELSFPSSYNKATGRVEGQYFGGTNTYIVDASTQTVTAFGETYPMPEGSYILRNEGDDLDDVYISTDILNVLWPLDFESSRVLQSISIETDRRLPFELAAERAKRQKELKARLERKTQNLDENFVYIPNGYKFLGPQALFLSQSIQWRNSSKTLSKGAFVGGEGDILGTEARYAANFAQSGSANPQFESMRLSLRRQDYGNGKLLPFGLSSVEVGDTNIYSPDLVSNSIGGAGISIRSGRKNFSSDFDEITVEGTSLPGWEVEIYRGNVLIDFGEVDAFGEYRFENIPINYGPNEIRVLLYGPQGQIEERVEEYRIARNFLKPGEISYQAGAVRTGNRFIDVSEKNNPDAELSKSIRIDRGLNPFITTFATLTEQPIAGLDKQTYATLGANFEAFGGIGRTELYKQIGAGGAFDLSYANRFLGVNTSLNATLYDDFESLTGGFGNGKKSKEFSVSLSKNLPVKLGSLNLNASADYTSFEDPDVANSLLLRSLQGLTTDYGGFSHSISARYSDSEQQDLQGQLSYSNTLNKFFSFSNSLSYDLDPNARFTSTNLDLRYRQRNKMSASLGFTQSLEDSSNRSADFGLSYNFKDFAANFNMDWDNENGTNFVFGTSTTLGPDSKSGIYKLTNRYEKALSAITFKVFHDVNGNGSFDEDEDEPVPNARLTLSNGQQSKGTDENGFTEVTRGNSGFVNITLHRPSLSYNPFLVPARKNGFATILRDGTKMHIDFPLIMSGSIDGTLSDTEDEGMSGMTMQLIDDQGQLAKEVKTISGGFYVFELVRPGKYIVQVSPEHRIFVPPKTVTVSSEDLFAYGVDLRVLEQVPTDETAAVEVERDGRVAHTYHDASVAFGGDENPAQLSDVFDSVETSTLPADDGVQSVVSAVRVGEYSDKTRLVLDLSGPSSYSVTKSKENTDVLFIELPNTSADGIAPQWKAGPNTLFSSIDIQPRTGGGIQLRLETRQPLRILKDALLPATNGLSDRLYIDFAP
jgi:hypothetical protein